MWKTRRSFLQSSTALAAGFAGGAPAAGAQAPGRGPAEAAGWQPASEIQVPKMKFFRAEISRMVLGVNPFYGYAHYNNNFGNAMREWYTPDLSLIHIFRDQGYKFETVSRLLCPTN